ncbi:DUF2510 domain-containing protein [Rhodoglobus aureus]|uniref:DUF2510 domain-containing protein n=1 Tax=Rhodoglobus aureus TaxID=191497 RepID=UPI003CD083E9
MSSAGWYPDPDDSLKLRYCNGTSWTDQTCASANLSDRPPPQTAAQSEPYPNHSGSISSPSKLAPASATALDPESRAAVRILSPERRVGWAFAWVLAAFVLFSGCSGGFQVWQMGVDGNGHQVTCNDGTSSLSGGVQGACSGHGGVR